MTTLEEFNQWFQTNKSVVTRRSPYDAAKLAWFAAKQTPLFDAGKSPADVSTFIIVKTEFVGFHRWCDAPVNVSFLRQFHRHVFKVEVTIRVDHQNRALEFFTEQQKVELFCQKFHNQHFEKSCEMLAQEILDSNPEYHSVKVSEDGENAGIVIRN